MKKTEYFKNGKIEILTSEGLKPLPIVHAKYNRSLGSYCIVNTEMDYLNVEDITWSFNLGHEFGEIHPDRLYLEDRTVYRFACIGMVGKIANHMELYIEFTPSKVDPISRAKVIGNLSLKPLI